MEIILAIVVASAVILFGALISIGNERQRKAIDDLREQVVFWAVQDLKIKREHLARTAQVADPLGWFNKIATRACGYDVNLQIIEATESPNILLFDVNGGNGKILLTISSPAEVRTMKKTSSNRLSQYSERNPLLSLPKKAVAIECSVLNNGIMFDLELPLAWKGLTGNDIGEKSLIWIYNI